MILFFMLARWSWPRFRYDQLMDLGWKVMIPWGLVNLVTVAVWCEYGNRLSVLFSIPQEWSIVAVGWCVLAISWFITVVADPTRSDNRPRRGVRP
jgi:NADH-quinone oxidoreductase subunit H